jgi:UDP-GlcNAc:undecaprenyl-phosphate/decaprenyl-phosphate GlcNAc-1-phosphate transferase
MNIAVTPVILSIITGILAFVVGLITVPIFGKAAKKWDIVDHPDGKIKKHTNTTPYLGGLAIYIAVLVAVSFTMDFDKRVMGLLLGGTLIVLIGLIDDFKALTPLQKLLGQILAVTIAVKSGVYIQKAAVPGFFHIPLTYIWILGMINAINFIDGVDGQAAGICFIAFLSFIFWGYINGDVALMSFSAAIAGSLIAFLIYNSYPASIFMGDTGSMFLGLIMGVVTILIDYRGVSKLTLFNPLVIMALPLFNMVYVMFVRIIQGVSPFKGTLDHWHDNLRSLGFSTSQIVLTSYVITAIFSLCALIILYLPFKQTLILQLSILAFLFIVAVLFFVRKKKIVKN